MSSQVQTQPRIAIFGASGPSGNAVLVHALQAGYHVHALARNPQKLADLLLEKDVPQSSLDQYLEITAGDVKDLSAVKKVLYVQGKPVTKILSSIGMSDADLFSLRTTPGHSICKDATTTILQGLRELDFAQKPEYIAISNRSISSGPRDYPLIHAPLYWSIVARPARDKLAMEKLIIAAEEEGIVGSYTLVRPPVLREGPSLGMSKSKAELKKLLPLATVSERKILGCGYGLRYSRPQHMFGRTRSRR